MTTPCYVVQLITGGDIFYHVFTEEQWSFFMDAIRKPTDVQGAVVAVETQWEDIAPTFTSLCGLLQYFKEESLALEGEAQGVGY